MIKKKNCPFSTWTSLYHFDPAVFNKSSKLNSFVFQDLTFFIKKYIKAWRTCGWPGEYFD